MLSQTQSSCKIIHLFGMGYCVIHSLSRIPVTVYQSSAIQKQHYLIIFVCQNSHCQTATEQTAQAMCQSALNKTCIYLMDFCVCTTYYKSVLLIFLLLMLICLHLRPFQLHLDSPSTLKTALNLSAGSGTAAGNTAGAAKMWVVPMIDWFSDWEILKESKNTR